MTTVIIFIRRLVALFVAIISLLGIKTDTETVELYANPASGYSWEYSFDKSGVLALTESSYSPDTSSILSGGGTQNFTFRALGSGTVNITFKYVSIDGTVASQYVYTYNVDVNGNIELHGIQ